MFPKECSQWQLPTQPPYSHIWNLWGLALKWRRWAWKRFAFVLDQWTRILSRLVCSRASLRVVCISCDGRLVRASPHAFGELCRILAWLPRLVNLALASWVILALVRALWISRMLERISCSQLMLASDDIFGDVFRLPRHIMLSHNVFKLPRHIMLWR